MKSSSTSSAVLLVTACLGMGLSACAGSSGSDPAVAFVGTPASRISDAAHGGTIPGFYFLPPIGAPVHRRGPTARGLSPAVTIEELAGRGVVATFAESGCDRGEDRDGDGVHEEDGRYLVEWEFEHAGVRSGFVYRIRVFVNGVELGFADAVRVRGKHAAAEARRQGFVPLSEDELEIAFRIEPEALGSALAQVGIDGGRVCAANGACIEIPPGALDAPTDIRIEQTTLPAPAGLGAVTPVYRLSPAGTVFAKPVRLSLPIPPGTMGSSIYWSSLGSESTFDPLGSSVSGGFVVAENVHFSRVFAGAASPVRTVIGTRVVTYISATTRVNAFDAPAVAVEATFADSAGALRTVPATFLSDPSGAATGVFVIHSVPNGRYLLRVANQYFVTDASTPDLGFSTPGRATPPMQLSPTPSPVLDVSVALGNAWQAGDWLELIGTENDMWDFRTERFATLAPGDTSAHFQIPMDRFNGSIGRRLFEQPGDSCPPGTLPGTWCGDRFHVAHISKVAGPTGVPCEVMTEFAQFSPFTTPGVPGSAVGIAAVLAPLPVTGTVDFDFRGSEFRAAIVADGNPAARPENPSGRFVALVGQPGLATDGFYGANADMMTVTDPSGTDLRTGLVAYGSPDSFGGNWGEIATMRWGSRVPVTAPGAAPTELARSPGTGFSWTDSVSNMAAPSVVAPVLTMPVGLTVTGSAGSVAFFTGGTGIGLTPTIAWSRPRVGDPDLYSIGVTRLVNQGGRTVLQGVAKLYTPETSMTLPSGILEPGQSYFFSVSAEKRAGATAPFRTALGDFAATTISGNFSP